MQFLTGRNHGTVTGNLGHGFHGSIAKKTYKTV